MGLELPREPEASSLVELASGIDALYMSGRAVLPELLLADLTAGRQEAESLEKAVPFELLGQMFQLQPQGWGKYRFQLRHPLGLLGFTPSLKLPAIRIQPKAEHLHGIGPAEVFHWWKDFLESLVGNVFLGISRLDLFTDWQGWSLTASDLPAFVGRATSSVTRAENDSFAGFEFGRRSTGTVCARIYDKTRQVKQKHLDYWYDIWGSSYQKGEQVLRIEFELGRKGLRQFGSDSAQQAITSSPQIWAGLTEEWLSQRVPTSDATKSRWPVSPDWLLIQRPAFRGDAIGLERIQNVQREANVSAQMPGLTGALSSIGALLGTDDIDETLKLLPGRLHDYGIMTGTTFPERVAAKKLKFA